MHTAKYIEELAKKNNVTYVKTPLDQLAETFSYLSDNEVVEDKISDTLLALERANIIDQSTASDLLYKVLVEARSNV